MASPSASILFWMFAVAPALAQSFVLKQAARRESAVSWNMDRDCCLFKSASSIISSRRQSTLHRASFIQQKSSMNPGDDYSASDSDSILDMSALQKRIDRQMTQYYELLFGDTSNNELKEDPPEEVHIIIYRPDTPEQGVHAVEYPKGSGRNFLLAFESMQECESFAQMLEDMHFGSGRGVAVDPPTPITTEWEPLLEYCTASVGIPVQFVPRGTGLTPPSDEADEIEYLGKGDPFNNNKKNEITKVAEEMDERLVQDKAYSPDDGALPEPGAWE
jgi:hypothetical protein